ncbi:hypothetical protein ACOMHN_011088 [Nucella lapillus]
MAHEKSQKRVGKRPGRKPSKIDQKAKLERSRQSARECRARKKLRYQYLEELVSSREKSVFSLRDEVEMYKRWSIDLDRSIVPDGLLRLLAQEEMQKPLTGPQRSPQSVSSTPTASPSSSSVDTEHMTAHLGGQSGRRGQLPAQVLPHHQVEQTRRQVLTRQPNITQSGPQQLSHMNKGSRSFEESGRSSASSTAVVASTMHRSGSVPNLAATSMSAFPEPASSATLVYQDFNEDSSTLKSTGFLTELSVLSKVVGDSEPSSNIPTVVSHHSPPSSVSKPDPSWTWEVRRFSAVSEASQGRTYPFKCASSVMQMPPSAQVTSQAYRGGVQYSSGSSVPRVPSFMGSCLSGGGGVPSPPVPYYQRPRSSSDLARKVTSSGISPVSSSLSLSQQHLPGLFHPPVTSYTTQGTYPTFTQGVTTCLNSSTVLQDTAPVCMGSELSASISEPIPHWYSFLDDLESVASLSARQGAFSDAGTPGSSRARSGACTPSSVESPYSQQLLQQQQQQQQDSGNDGNIPNIISDLLGQSQSS